MIHTILFFLHYTLLLLFGILSSVAFSGVRLTRKSLPFNFALFALCGSMQLIIFLCYGEEYTWKMYPAIVHLPTILWLCFRYRKPFSIALTAVTSAYLFCQPANFMGMLCNELTNNLTIEYLVRICVLLFTGAVSLLIFAPYFSRIFVKDNGSVFIFCIIPIVYYLFEYSFVIYTNFYSSPLAAEFMPFLLCIMYMIFCIVYYKEYEQKAYAEHQKQIIRLTIEQQSKEIEAVKRSKHEIKLLRHDMRLILNQIAVCLEENDVDSAKKLVAGFSSNVAATSITEYSKNPTINYILSDFAAKCKELQIAFYPSVTLGKLSTDEIAFSTILSNTLDNALNAQKELPAANREIKLMLKNSNDKLLLSVKNSFHKAPVFVDDLPISDQKGHGYGVQSIRYMSERLGGNCQFTVEDNYFITRVIVKN